MSDKNVAWLFPGQGAQEVGMGRDLFDGSAAARQLFDVADETLGYSLAQLCFNGPEERLQDTQFAQPALFTCSLACLAAARELGAVQELPAFLAGHSLGEYTALVAAEALDFDDGLRLVHERGRLMQLAAQERPGSMAALLGLDEDTVAWICEETGAELCNINAPGQIVVGGRSDAVEGAMALALERGAQRGVKLRVSGGFHTSLMQPAAEGMARAVAAAPIRDPRVPIVANTSAQPITTGAALREELVQQLVRPVRWLSSVQFLREQGVGNVIEFGPGRVLTGLAKRIDRSISVRNVSDLASAAPAAPTPAPP